MLCPIKLALKSSILVYVGVSYVQYSVCLIDFVDGTVISQFFDKKNVNQNKRMCTAHAPLKCSHVACNEDALKYRKRICYLNFVAKIESHGMIST